MSEQRGYSFGTFKGVFTPSILTILGVVMYLRIGWVLGNLGLFGTLLVITLASSITFFTGLSLATLATNMKVRQGGAYYIISRSLGIEAGAAIGLPLFMAQALGIAFYITGFAESIVGVFSWMDATTVGVITLVILSIIAYTSADLALRSQFVIMAIIFASLVSFFLDGRTTEIGSAINMTPHTLGFWKVFAVFFPAVTGIEAGIAMSGDLKDPSKSLPVGTILAVITGYLVYIAIPLYLTYLGVDRITLITDPLIMEKVARWGFLVIAGIWSASLSSALGSLLGAPRTLQALALDGIVPKIFSRTYGSGNDPRVATVACFLVGLVGIYFGDLNAIAPILSMFFLTSYGTLNLCAAIEELLSPPSWRPTFRISWKISLIGFIACLCVMLMIDAGATIIALALTIGIYLYMRKRRLRGSFTDLRQGIMMYVVREILYRLNKDNKQARNWQPNILVLSGSPSLRWYLIELAQALSRNRSFLTVATIIAPSIEQKDRLENISSVVRDYLAKRNVNAFVLPFVSSNPLKGARELVKAYGFGPLVPNIVLLGETEDEKNFIRFSYLIRSIVSSGKNLIIVREKKDKDKHDHDERKKRIDVWVRAGSKNSALIIALASLLKRSDAWSNSRVILKRIVRQEEDKPIAEEEIRKAHEDQRLDMEAEVIVNEKGEFLKAIRQSSLDADFVIMGMRIHEEGEDDKRYAEYYKELLIATKDLPTTALVIAGEKVDFRELFGT